MAVIRHPSQRIAVLVDVANLYHSAKHLFGSRVNFKELLETAVAKRQLVRSIVYVVRTGESEEQAFFDALTKASFEVRMKDLQIFAGGTKKGDWDVGIAIDAIRLAPSLDAIILATGDGDFVPLVEYLQLHFGIQVEVLAFGRSASMKLKEAADDFIDLGDLKFLIRIPRKTQQTRKIQQKHSPSRPRSAMRS